MLNMQNVKDIEIPEGDVRTIHDKDDRLLWGKLAYDTKYAGDTYQQTTTGKNLLHGSNNGSNRGIDYTWKGASVTLYGETTSTYSNITNNDFMDLEVGTYTISLETASTLRFNFRTYTTEDGNTTYNIEPGETSVSFTIPEGSTGAKFRLIYISGFSAGLNIDTTVNIQLEKGSTATTYEPYTGGIPAPSPDYPQDIQVVTGEQTVTISDGVDSEDFTISLGSIELCKIGDYQDYIYKSGADWYVHKVTGKFTFGGSTISWSSGGEAGAGYYAWWRNTSSIGLTEPQVDENNTPALLTTFGQMPYGSGKQQVGFMTKYSTTTPNIVFITDSLITSSDLNTALSGSIYYYALATPTDTKITDATLISQLNAVHEWLTRYGYNSTVTGNLPIIINQTNL